MCTDGRAALRWCRVDFFTRRHDPYLRQIAAGFSANHSMVGRRDRSAIAAFPKEGLEPGTIKKSVRADAVREVGCRALAEHGAVSGNQFGYASRSIDRRAYCQMPAHATGNTFPQPIGPGSSHAIKFIA